MTQYKEGTGCSCRDFKSSHVAVNHPLMLAIAQFLPQSLLAHSRTIPAILFIEALYHDILLHQDVLYAWSLILYSSFSGREYIS